MPKNQEETTNHLQGAQNPKEQLIGTGFDDGNGRREVTTAQDSSTMEIEMDKMEKTNIEVQQKETKERESQTCSFCFLDPSSMRDKLNETKTTISTLKEEVVILKGLLAQFRETLDLNGLQRTTEHILSSFQKEKERSQGLERELSITRKLLSDLSDDHRGISSNIKELQRRIVDLKLDHQEMATDNFQTNLKVISFFQKQMKDTLRLFFKLPTIITNEGLSQVSRRLSPVLGIDEEALSSLEKHFARHSIPKELAPSTKRGKTPSKKMCLRSSKKVHRAVVEGLKYLVDIEEKEVQLGHSEAKRQGQLGVKEHYDILASRSPLKITPKYIEGIVPETRTRQKQIDFLEMSGKSKSSLRKETPKKSTSRRTTPKKE